MTAQIADQLRAGIALHEEGRIAEAESAYQAALDRQPASGDAWHLLARAALDRGDTLPAAARAVQAIRLNPTVPAFHNTLGEIVAAQGKMTEAAVCFREALHCDPRFVPALVNLGNVLQASGDLDGASVAYWKAIDARPDCAEAFTNLGNALRAKGCAGDSIQCHREAVRLRPGSAEAAVNLAAGLVQQGQFAEAERFARRAVELNPGLAEAFSNLSVALLNQGHLEEAEIAARAAIDRSPRGAHLHANLASILLKQQRLDAAEASCRQALELDPRFPEAANNLGLVLQAQDRLGEAAQSLESAIAWRPSAEFWTNLGTVREAQNRPADALACFDQAIAARSDFPKPHFCRALTLLRAGCFEEGFAEYEWRWKARGEMARAQSLPAWDGSVVPGQTILLFGEQGLGDTIQFARFARLVAERGARVVLECQTPLVGLAARFPGVAQVVSADEPLPACDAQAALMSLPYLLKADPQSSPYLSASDKVVEAMRQTIGSGSRLRVGLAWAGNSRHAGNRHRSIALETLAPLLDTLDVEWFSLHKEPVCETRLRQPLPAESGLEELAGLISCLDLVVTVDSMPAHLAGALGRPVWLLLSQVPDWRWQTGRSDSPWYPTIRLFRQEQPGDWGPVMKRVGDSLQGLTRRADMHE